MYAILLLSGMCLESLSNKCSECSLAHVIWSLYRVSAKRYLHGLSNRSRLAFDVEVEVQVLSPRDQGCSTLNSLDVHQSGISGRREVSKTFTGQRNMHKEFWNADASDTSNCFARDVIRCYAYGGLCARARPISGECPAVPQLTWTCKALKSASI